MDDPYAILGLNRDADHAKVRDRYRFLAHAYHPDKFPNEAHKQQAEEVFIRVTAAFRTLADPLLRAEYDRHFGNGSGGPQVVVKHSSPDEMAPSPPARESSTHREARPAFSPTAAVFLIVALGVSSAAIWDKTHPGTPATDAAERGLVAQPPVQSVSELIPVVERLPADLPVQAPPPAPKPLLAAAKTRPFVNSLGMKFVPVPGTNILFSVWETRVQDYVVFVRETGREWRMEGTSAKPSARLAGSRYNASKGHPLPHPPATAPAVEVSWEDARQFCQWLTDRERGAGRLPATLGYRMPTDEEWSLAVEMRIERGNTPREREIDGWKSAYYPKFLTGSVEPNIFGIFDLQSSVWEWCEDRYALEGADRVLRGGPWYLDRRVFLPQAFRNFESPEVREGNIGFRCAVAVTD